MAKKKTEVDFALEEAAAAFKSTAQAEIDEIKRKMQDVLRVFYKDAPKEALRPDLPAPRLQLRWAEDHRYSYPLTCYYELVFPLRELDCRNDEKQGFGVVELSRTSAGGGARDHWSDNGWDNTPFRDGSHIQWDCDAFGGALPMYVIRADGATQLLTPRPKKEAA